MKNQYAKVTLEFFQRGSGLVGATRDGDGVFYLDRMYLGELPLPGQIMDCEVVYKLSGKSVSFVRPLRDCGNYSTDRPLRQKLFMENCLKQKVTIVSKQSIAVSVSCKKLRFQSEVFLSGKFLGYKDKLADDAVFGKQTVHGFRLNLSNGKSVEAYEQHLQVISHWSEDCNYPIKKIALRSFAELPAGQKSKALRYEELAKLAVGDEVGYEIPFQRFEQWLTDGIVWLPQKRPFGLKEWKTVPFAPMSDLAWAKLVDVLEGKVLEDMFAYYKGESKSKGDGSKGSAPRVRLNERQSEIKLALEQTCSPEIWEAADVRAVSVGNNVIFHVERPQAPTLYVVDNPGIGAIYVFDSYSQAMELASGALPRATAMREKHLRVIHRGEWKSRLSAILRLTNVKSA